MKENKTEEKQTKKVRVRYEAMTAAYASQFMINSTAEDITINFSSGYMVDPSSNDTMLPVHTRIAMSRDGARRLHTLLGQIVNEKQAPQLSEKNDGIPKEAKAQLPSIEN